MPNRCVSVGVWPGLPSMRQLVLSGLRVGGVIAVGAVVFVLGWTEDRVSLEPAELKAVLRYDDAEYRTQVRVVNHSIRKVRLVSVSPI